MKYLFLILFFLAGCSNIVPRALTTNETPQSKEQYEQITIPDSEGFYFSGGINDIYYMAWALYAGKRYGFITEDQIDNFCYVLKSLDKGAYYVYRPGETRCWSRDNYIIVAYALYQFKDNICAAEALNTLLEKVTNGASLCLQSIWIPEHLGFFDRIRGIEDKSLLHAYDIALHIDVGIQVSKPPEDSSDKILLWPLVRAGVDIFPNYASLAAYEDYQQIDIKKELDIFYSGSPNPKAVALGELLKGVL